MLDMNLLCVHTGSLSIQYVHMYSYIILTATLWCYIIPIL